ncbi:MAG: flagellar biosynthesis protein FlgJ [Pseudomonadota bacterium]
MALNFLAPVTNGSATPVDHSSSPPSDLQISAKKLTTTFLAEMLKASGVVDVFGQEGEMSSTFSSFVVTKIAEDMVETTPGFVDQVYQQLKSGHAS